MFNAPSWIVPQWPCPDTVQALMTTRHGGYSQGSFACCNLGLHVGDDPAIVSRNRDWLCREAGLPAAPLWLTQQHGCVAVDAATAPEACPADASFTHQSGYVCAVLTADCLPILLCENQGRGVAAIHAGWRGLAAGIIEQTIIQLGYAPQQLLAWLGAAIGPRAFVVRDDVYRCFCDQDQAASGAFQRAVTGGCWHADLQQLARLRLQRLGVSNITSFSRCTVEHENEFFSYRREQQTGRQAALIWITHCAIVERPA
jgi:hypothetical protein